MSQPSVAAYFTSRKRIAGEELRNKAKVRLLGDDEQHKEAVAVVHPLEKSIKTEKTKTETKKDLVARNLLFDLSSKPSRPARTRVIKSRKSSVSDDKQQNIDSMFKLKEPGDGACLFAKLGNLSPKKTAKSRTSKSTRAKKVVEDEVPTTTQVEEEKTQEPETCKTPTKEPAIFKTPTKKSTKDMSYDEVKSKVTTSARLRELRAKIAQFQSSEKKLESLERAHRDKREETRRNEERVKIKEFERIELEIPVSPHKALLQSPGKFFSPVKTTQTLSPKASPARRLLFEPKEAPASPVKASPTKASAYQRYQSLAVDEGRELPLPFKYRFLAEIFRSVDTVSAMLYNRREVVTFRKLRPAVQELVRRNFTVDHLAQIKSVWPEAYDFRQDKMRSFAVSKVEKYELVITPRIETTEEKSGRCTPDEENVLESANNTHMSPNVLLERKRKFVSLLLERVKDEHEKFLQSLEVPLNVSRNKITRWHPEFELENCKDIEMAELPKEPTQEKNSAKDVLEAASKLFMNSRMQKAMTMLADIKTDIDSPPVTDLSADVPESTPKLNSSVVDTPPVTPQTQPAKAPSNPALKGIPTSLLEKIRAKQAAKAMEMMTRSTDGHKEAAMYARLPDMAKIVRNIFVSEKKNVLTLEQVVKKLDDSYVTKLTANELEEHLKLLCKLLPLWIGEHLVRKVRYLKLAKDFDMSKVVHRLEVLAQEKVGF